ncbi:MAG TPA: rifamycin-inactivating phosphotransferase [Kofleriaceae bacterium]|nr:rifamycin-inactivating phosphotransferase [Kofleriaceae bacterium]
MGELARVGGIRVPNGFCVSTDAFARVVERLPSLRERLEGLATGPQDAIRAASADIRRLIEGAVIPDDLRHEIEQWLARLGDKNAYAVRSSATAEDLPTASFAGQHDTRLNVIGVDEVVNAIRACWASLFSERAVVYRRQQGFDHRRVRLAVVVHRMVFPTVAGILFTADPVSGHRRVTSIEASFGLGEALVAGRVTPDTYRVRDGIVIDRKIAAKARAVVAVPTGGVREVAIEPAQQSRPALTDAQLAQLEHIGRTIEAHFGRPQDIEWCLADETFHVVQSRAITTLFPIPEPSDGANHVYVSVGHQQMMTDALKPLGLSLQQLTAMRPMFTAAGRQFVDVTAALASPARENLLDVLGASDPLIRDALETLLERGDFIPDAPSGREPRSSITTHKGRSAADIAAPVANDRRLVPTLIEACEQAVTALQDNVRTRSGPELFDVLAEDIGRMKHLLSDGRTLAAILAAINASTWLNENVNTWLGEKNFADTIARSLPTNITSEMGLALADVADVIRSFPRIVEYLQQVTDEQFLEQLPALEGGDAARAALVSFLETYGMRCAGEIDITRDRWAEKPTALVPALLANLKNLAPGEARRSVAQRQHDALAKEREILARLEQLPDGPQHAADTALMIGLVRDFMGYREYPKYHIVSRYFVYKQALLREADALVRANVISDRRDVYFLTFGELREVVRTHQIDRALIEQRKDEHRAFERLAPPRVITSDGEIIAGAYKSRAVPPGALVGLAVSSGVVEGRARVITAMEDADLEDGDILVTSCTDPSWTPLFVSIAGLVTAAGGLMTHGAVIAREYGLPAVVGVEHATQRIRDGQRIRLSGTDGYVELLAGVEEARIR